MNQLDYMHDLATFMALWSRARTGVQSLVNKSPDELLYFDPIDIPTQKFFDLIQTPVTVSAAARFLPEAIPFAAYLFRRPRREHFAASVNPHGRHQSRRLHLLDEARRAAITDAQLTYSVRDESNTGYPTADVYINGTKTTKIRLK
ncbi:hypothetical protein PQR39_21805 [Paraburkholderia sediminicola]